MSMDFIIKNLEILPADEAVVPLQNISFSYGYGVYENIRVTNGQIRYLDEHIKRLFVSCQMLEIVSPYSSQQITSACQKLAEKFGDTTYNMKIILIGGDEPQLFVLPLAPKFVDRKLYRDGVKVITTEYERYLPQAKSLNMLGSYMVYKKAQAAGAYDALLVNHQGEITEGSRTNFYATKDKTIYTAPDDQVLAGVTRTHILELAKEQGFEIVFETPKLASLRDFDGFFISNTSSKLLPISNINDEEFKVTAELQDLSKSFREKY